MANNGYGQGQNEVGNDPDPQEIREACLAIQECWNPAERVKRKVGLSSWQVPHITGFKGMYFHQPHTYE